MENEQVCAKITFPVYFSSFCSVVSLLLSVCPLVACLVSTNVYFLLFIAHQIPVIQKISGIRSRLVVLWTLLLLRKLMLNTSKLKLCLPLAVIPVHRIPIQIWSSGSWTMPRWVFGRHSPVSYSTESEWSTDSSD
jgi:hypothetical protein